jgi:ribonuclease P protein component
VGNRTKREKLLSKKVYTKNFVAVFDFLNENNFGLFFALSRKTAKAVKRNKIKRLFRNLFLKDIKPLLGQDIENFSLCLISKKGVKIEKEYLESGLKNELKEITNKIINKIK